MKAFNIKVYTLFLMFVSFVFLGSSLSFAKTELYDVIDSTSRPYMVAIEVESGSSDKEPGIYVGDSAGKGWKLALPGKVLMDFKTSTAFNIMELSSMTKKFESLVILNGYLTYLNIDSNIDAKNFVALGSSSKKIYDPIIGSHIELPQIENISDLSIYVTSLGLEQLVIVSQKLDTPMAPGVTYAFTINFSSLASASTISVDPVLLDYNFYSSPTLSKFIYSYDSKGLLLKSPYIGKVLSKSNPFDSDKLVDWRLKLAAVLKDPSKYLSNTSLDNMPLYNYKKLEIQLSHPILELGKKPGVSVMQMYDPIKSRASFHITALDTFSSGGSFNRADSAKTFQVDGDVSRTFVRENMKQDAPKYRSTDEKLNDNIYKDDSRNFIIFFVDSVPYFFSLIKDVTPLRLLSAPEIQNVSEFAVIPIPNDHARSTNFKDPVRFLLSFKNIKQESVTYLYQVSYQQFSKEFVVSDRMQISDEFYSVEELRARLSDYLFDIVTPKQDNLFSYEQARKKYAAQVDLENSNSQEGIRTDFLEALRTTVFEDGFEYRIYGDELRPAEKTGLYLASSGFARIKEGLAHHLAFGEVLPEPSEKYPYWANKTIMTKMLGSVKLYFIVMDKLFHKGADSYSTALVVRPADRNIPPFTINLGSEQESKSQLNFVMILTVKDCNFFYVLKSSMKGKDSKKSKVVLSIKRVDIKESNIEDRKDVFQVQEGSYKVLVEGENLSPEEIINRIVVSKDHVFYWSVVPDINMTDPEFRVKEFGKDVVFKPADLTETISFAPYKELMDKGTQPFTVGYDKGPAYNWRVRKPVSNSTDSLYTLYKVGKLPNRSYNIFPNFLEFLDRTVRSTQNGKYVIVIPDGLEQYIKDLVFGRMFESSETDSWSLKNPNVEFYVDRGNEVKRTAPEYTNYMSSITKHVVNKSIFLTDLHTILDYDRPQGTEAFKLKYEISEDSEDSSDYTHLTQTSPFSEKASFPHAIYYILTEGVRVQYQDFKQHVQEHPYTYTTLMFATETEWEFFKNDLSGSPEDLFDVISSVQVHTLAPPDENAQFNLFKEILHSKDVQSKNYVYDVSNISREQNLTDEGKEEVFIKYLISRMNALATNSTKNKFEILTELLIKMKGSLISDPSVRKRGKLDRIFIENILAQVFDLPLNLEYLPEDDPLKILSRPDIAILLQDKGGYKGFNHYPVIDTILAQTRPETTRKIPSSIILFGDSGTGKTELFLALTRTLNLKIYDPFGGEEKNNDAQAFILNCSKVVAEKTTGRSELMSVSEALNNLHKFLALPLGYRGFILFDDLHAAEANVRHRLVSEIRTMLDTDKTDTTIKTEGEDGGYITVKNRNLTIFITLNPTSDTERLARFGSDRNKKNLTDDEKILATLSDRSNSFEMSFLRRFGLIYPMNTFPKEAKKASLAVKLKPLMKDTFTKGSLVIPSSNFIDTMVSSFPDADARVFLTGVTNGVSQKISIVKQQYDYDISRNSSLFIMNTQLKGKSIEQIRKEAKANEEIALINFITQNTYLYSTEGLEGKLLLTKIIMDNFRINVFECFIDALKNSVFVTSPQNKSTFKWISAAIRDYVSGNASIPINKLFLDAKIFGLEDNLEKEKFVALVNSYSEGIEYNSTFPMRTGTSDLMSIFGSSQTPSRLDVNYEIVKKNTEFLKKFLANNLGITFVGSELYFSDFDKWIRDINEIKSNRYGYTFHQEIFSLYRNYLQDLSDPSLKEVRTNSNDILTIYMKTRYFLASLDKAIMSLPWANVTMFLNNHLIQAMNYMEVSSKGGVQEFLFGGQYSLIRPTVEDYIEILLRQYIQSNDLDPKSVKQQQDSFERNCASMFSEE